MQLQSLLKSLCEVYLLVERYVVKKKLDSYQTHAIFQKLCV